MPVPLADRARLQRMHRAGQEPRPLVHLDLTEIGRLVMHNIQTRIDEEGCGVVFAAIVYGRDGRGPGKDYQFDSGLSTTQYLEWPTGRG